MSFCWFVLKFSTIFSKFFQFFSTTTEIFRVIYPSLFYQLSQRPPRTPSDDPLKNIFSTHRQRHRELCRKHASGRHPLHRTFHRSKGLDRHKSVVSFVFLTRRWPSMEGKGTKVPNCRWLKHAMVNFSKTNGIFRSSIDFSIFINFQFFN